MWTIYVLQSRIDGDRYVGITRDIKRRMYEHNSGKVRSTKSRKPFDLVYTEYCSNSSDARVREKYLKSAAGRRFIDKMLSLPS